jgi:hypothetical protein
MQSTLVGLTHDMGFRIFSFDRRGDDNVRTRCYVRADLALTRAYGIQVQELPLLCRDLLDRCENNGQVRSLTFAECDMRACAEERAAVREEAAKKRRLRRKPAGEGAETSSDEPVGPQR